VAEAAAERAKGAAAVARAAGKVVVEAENGCAACGYVVCGCAACGCVVCGCAAQARLGL